MLDACRLPQEGVRCPLEQYLREINHTPLLGPREEQELACRVRAGDSAARDRMVCANLRLVVNIAQRFTGKGLGLQDLIEEGNLGLLQAVERFDPARNTRFSTYAIFWIKQAIRQALLNTSRTIRIPCYLVELLGKWQQTSARLHDELGRSPTNEEVAARLKLPPRKLKLLLEANRLQHSRLPLDEARIGVPLEELLLEKRPQPADSQPNQADDLQRLLHHLDALEERQALVLRLRFGIGEERPQTLREVGERLGLTSERVRQIESAALKKLNRRMQAG